MEIARIALPIAPARVSSEFMPNAVLAKYTADATTTKYNNVEVNVTSRYFRVRPTACKTMTSKAPCATNTDDKESMASAKDWLAYRAPYTMSRAVGAIAARAAAIGRTARFISRNARDSLSETASISPVEWLADRAG